MTSLTTKRKAKSTHSLDLFQTNDCFKTAIFSAQNNFPTSTTLHSVLLTVMTNAECAKSFDVPLHGSHMCTRGVGGVGTCDGDSGGPLTVVWRNRRTLVSNCLVSICMFNSKRKPLNKYNTHYEHLCTSKSNVAQKENTQW